MHRPVIRQEPKGTGAAVTWAEFVEAGLLRQYRRELKVPLPELRAFIELLRQQFDVTYPLADRRPYANGKALVLEAQEQAGLPGESWLVTVADGRLLLTPLPAGAFQRYMASIGKLGGQNKTPRLANDRGVADGLLGAE